MNYKSKTTLSIIASIMLVNNLYAKEEQKLQDMIVTAQKVEENLQEVPISISVFDEHDIEDNGIRTVSDIASYVPNFQQFSTGGAGMYTPSMRGLVSDVHTLSSPVATYIDGISYTSSMGNNVVLEDIQRIEVLRGPQGTLYGKNAYAGVVNIITKKPNNQTRGKIKVDIGTDEKREYSLNVSGPIIKDKFYAGISYKHYEKNGYIKNEYLNKWDDDRKDDIYKLILRTTPRDDLDISLISSYLKKDDGSTTVMPLSAKDVRITNSDMQGYTKSESLSHALKVEYDMNNMDFSSITTYKEYDDKRATDYDYSPAQISHSKVDSKYKNYSQEFKLSGDKNNLRWLSGLYFERDKQNPNMFRNDISTTKGETKTDSIGVFVNGDYKLDNNLILMSGLRYDKDNIETSDTLSTYKNDKSYGEISPKIGLKYIINKDLTTYVSATKGYKSGGYYMMAPINLRSYDKETMWNYEVGLKSKSLDDKLKFNMAIYYMDIKDMQVASNLTPFSAYISNAATATNKGVEIETSYQVLDSLNLFSNLGYSQIKFDEFKDKLGNYSGNYNPYAPKYNYSIGAKYRDDKGIFAQINFNGQSSFYADKANRYKNNGYTIVNAKVGYESEEYDIHFYFNNITNREYNDEGYFNYYTMVSPPRETGIQLTYRF